MTIRYCPIVPEDPQPDSSVTQWSLGIAMFAAFVIPFVLLFTSAQYRAVVHAAQQRLGVAMPSPLPSEATRTNLQP